MEGKTYFVSGKTDKNGLFTGQGATEYYAVYGADADGYYGTSFDYSNFTGYSGVLGFRKWQPWNPTLKVVLKKIKNPIAMYAYGTDRIKHPKQNEFIGYDLVKHDWVSPYGKGSVSDFLFKLENDFISNNNYKIKLTTKFSNLADGLKFFSSLEQQGSHLRSANQAPLNGYQSELIQTMSMDPEKGFKYSFNREEGGGYYFRGRCDGDTSDSCLYGKIYGNIEFGKNQLIFNYYLNPSIGDTNIEFDPKKNLFKGFKRTLHRMSKP